MLATLVSGVPAEAMKPVKILSILIETEVENNVSWPCGGKTNWFGVCIVLEDV